MGEKHVVRFEPVGVEIEVDENQTILRAAAEQGVQLMHGCKEGQCAACKSFVLDGDDIELDRYSTFALPDFELEEGFTLLCRAHVYEDVTIELLNYDEEIIRGGLPLRTGTVEVVFRGATGRAPALAGIALPLPPAALPAAALPGAAGASSATAAGLAAPGGGSRRPMAASTNFI